MLTFIATLTLLVIISGFVCNGWYDITRYEIVQYPDGTTKTQGKIFKNWQKFFLTIYKYDQKRFNKAYTFAAITETLTLKKSRLFDGGRLVVHKDVFFVYEVGEDSKEDFYVWRSSKLAEGNAQLLEKLLLCKIGWSEAERAYFFYNDYPVYMLPEWIRNPLSECVVCYASVYGSMIYWGFVYFQQDAFDWTENKIGAYFFFWIIFIVSNCFINGFLYRKNN